MKFLNATATMSRVIRTIALKSRDVYSAPSVAFHIYGYAPIGARLRQDGVRLLSLSLSPPLPNHPFLHSIFVAMSCETCFGIRIAVSIIKPRMEMDGLNTDALWYLNVLKGNSYIHTFEYVYWSTCMLSSPYHHYPYN